jgi:hypothetical protein
MPQFDTSIVASLPPQSLRIVCSYDGEDVTLLYSAEVDCPAWNFHPIDRVGYFLDSYDSDDNLISRQFLYNAFTTHTEVLGEDGLHHIEKPTPTGAFSILVPLTPNTDHFTVTNVAYDPPIDPNITPSLFNPPKTTREIASFPI